MTAHACTTLAPEGECFRCDLNRDEMSVGHEADHLVGPAVRGAMGTLLWLADETAGPGEYVPDLRSIPAEAEAEVRDDLTDFILANAQDCLAYVEARRGQSVAEYDGQTYVEWAAGCIGHDFMLTRNGHGAGFWDRGLGDLGDRLTAASEAYGSLSLDQAEDGTFCVIH